MSTFSPNLNIEEVARGADVGVWDTPTNSNWTLMDSAIGNIATLALNNSNIILTATQFQSENITFNSTLTGSVTITFPTSFIKPYTIGHFCTGSSAYTITLATTAAGGQVIAIPPGQYCDVINDGTNLTFKNLPHIGSYWDYAGSSVPAWVSTCTIQPWLNCAGGTFSAATFPVLAAILGSTTLPDMRSATKYYLAQGSGRLSTVTANTPYSLVGAQQLTLAANQIPAISGSNTITINVGQNVAITTGTIGSNNLSGGGSEFYPQSTLDWSGTNSFSGTNTITVGSGSTPVETVAPGIMSGICMIRAG